MSAEGPSSDRTCELEPLVRKGRALTVVIAPAFAVWLRPHLGVRRRQEKKAAPKDGLSRCGDTGKAIPGTFFLSHVHRHLSRLHGGTNLPHLSIKHNEDPGFVKGGRRKYFRH